MANDIPHDGASPEMEVDPELEPLPLSIRPFDPATYHPKIHVLSPDNIRKGPFTTRAGVIFISWEWYKELPDSVRYIINEASFGSFCMGLSRLITSWSLLGALVERWWDTTDSFHFSITGEMTITPFDFSMLTGIEVGGHPIPYDTDMGEGTSTYLSIRDGLIHLVCRPFQRDNTSDSRRDRAVCSRFPNRPGGLVPCLILRLGRCWLGHLIWVYAYFSTLSLEPEVEMSHVIPYSHRYDGRYQRRSQESIPFFHRYFDTVTATEGVGDQFAGAREASCFWFLLEGPVCRAWFLGERFLRQTIGLPESVVPMPPPTYMRATEKFIFQEMMNFTRGWGANFFLVEGDYTPFIQTYLMPPLTGARGGEKVRAPSARESGRGARATRTRSRRDVQSRQRTKWPELPTTLTCWQHTGEAYQIPIEPTPAGHELVGVRGSTPVCTTLYIFHVQFISVMLYRILIFSTHLQAPIEYTCLASTGFL
ncbi:hypothetical protein CsSME_00019746 [Camellia sinensis var. sinensis]